MVVLTAAYLFLVVVIARYYLDLHIAKDGLMLAFDNFAHVVIFSLLGYFALVLTYLVYHLYHSSKVKLEPVKGYWYSMIMIFPCFIFCLFVALETIGAFGS